MKSSSSIVKVPATPEYVLDVLLEQSRQGYCQESCDRPESGPVTLDSPVEVLCESCGIIDDFDHVFYPIDWFGLDETTWWHALGTVELKTARDFCELIAVQITLPQIPLVSFCGQTCQPASVFLAIRALLQEAGVDANQIAPSTPLQEYTRDYKETFRGPIARLAPGALPHVRIDEGWKYLRQFIRDIWGIPVLLVYFYTFFHPKAYPGLFAAAVVIYVILILITVDDEKAPPVRVEIGELRTFRDLSELIARRAVFQA